MTEKQRAVLEKHSFKNKTEEEKRRIIEKSIETRRRNKKERESFQTLLKTLMDSDISDARQKKILKQFGFVGEQQCNKALLMIALFKKGMSGDIMAINKIIDMVDDVENKHGTASGQTININLVTKGEEHKLTKQEMKEIKAAQQDQDWTEETDDEWDDEY